VSQQVEQFHQLVLQNHSLRSQLKAAGDLTSLVQMTVQLGKAHGYSFTPQEVERYINQNRLALMLQFS
jgi:hypothetical protein